jgi:hypothetical protein
MENELIYRINHGAWIDLSNPKKNALYTAYIDSKGKKVSKTLAVYRVIKRLEKEGQNARAIDLKSMYNDPEIFDNNNYLQIKLVKKELPKKVIPNKTTQMELKFGPTIPLNVESAFRRSLNEMMEADVVGVVSTHGGSVGNKDFYATGDSRIPKSIFGGVIFRRIKLKKKHKKRKK